MCAIDPPDAIGSHPYWDGMVRYVAIGNKWTLICTVNVVEVCGR